MSKYFVYEMENEKKVVIKEAPTIEEAEFIRSTLEKIRKIDGCCKLRIEKVFEFR